MACGTCIHTTVALNENVNFIVSTYIYIRKHRVLIGVAIWNVPLAGEVGTELLKPFLPSG